MKKLLAIRSSVTMVDQMVQYQCGKSTATQTITGIQIHMLGLLGDS